MRRKGNRGTLFGKVPNRGTGAGPGRSPAGLRPAGPTIRGPAARA